MRALSCGTVVLVGLALGACCVRVGGLGTSMALATFHPEPMYRTELIAFDEGLVGNWNETGGGNPGAESLMFTERATYATGGRISNPPPVPLGDAPTGSASIRVYSLLAQTRLADGDSMLAMYDAVLLRIDGETFLGIQRMIADLPITGPFIGGLPVHQIVKAERSGDSLIIRRPTNGAVWIPLVRPVADQSNAPVAPPADALGLVGGADQLIECLRLANRTPGSWGEPTMLARGR